MHMRKPSSQKAFTLVEMLVSTAVFSIIMAMAFSTLQAASEARRAAAARYDIYRNGYTVLAFIAQELRSAKLAEQDTRFNQSSSPTVAPTDLNNPNNGRGRFMINDWPQVKTEAQSKGLQVSLIPYIGNGKDDDGDGSTDEEAFDGMDNDGDGEPNSPVNPSNNRKMADGSDNNKDGQVDEGIDEDIFYPRDMLNFVTFRDGQETEVGYAIDPVTGRDLWRRTAFSAGAEGQLARLDGIYPVAVCYEALGAAGKLEQYPPTSFESDVPQIQPVLAPWFDTADLRSLSSSKADPGERPRLSGTVKSNAQGTNTNDSFGVTQVYDVMALNILGFDCRAYYYDYRIGEDNGSNLAETGNISSANPYTFPALSWDSSFENYFLNPYTINTPDLSGGVLPNEPNDLAVITADSQWNDPSKLYVDNINSKANRIALASDRTDGLPRMVEITLFVQDQNRLRETPVQISSRIWLPFGKGE